MSEEHMKKHTSAASALFKHLAGSDYSTFADYEDFFSELSNKQMLEMLQDLSEYFSIDAEKMQQFIKAYRKCGYCGEHNAPEPDEHGEHVCEQCKKEETD
jgi:NADH pyrophosphatase NudC (nudix superfamily)